MIFVKWKIRKRVVVVVVFVVVVVVDSCRAPFTHPNDVPRIEAEVRPAASVAAAAVAVAAVTTVGSPSVFAFVVENRYRKVSHAERLITEGERKNLLFSLLGNE